MRAFEYFGAVPEVVVPDQLRSAVRGPDRYEPDINPTYLEMAQHYGVTVIPARPRRPRDKAKVEAGVLVAQRWILAALRLEVLEDRYDQSSTVLTSQLPIKTWHQAIGEATIADAICDRLVHNAHLVALRGGSMRKKKAISSEGTETKN